MTNSQRYASCINKILAKNLPRAAIRLQNKVKANKKSFSLNFSAEAGKFFKFYVESKGEEQNKIFTQ